MITFSRIAAIQAGKAGPAMAWAQEICAYAKDAYGMTVEMAVPVGGNPSRIAWTVRYDCLAAMEAAQDRMLQDARYQQIVAKGGEWLISGATRDSLWKSL